jgi:hypothetical protein
MNIKMSFSDAYKSKKKVEFEIMTEALNVMVQGANPFAMIKEKINVKSKL